MKKKKAKIDRIRKNFRLPAELTEWAEGYVDKKGTNLTQLIIDCLIALRDQEELHVPQ